MINFIIAFDNQNIALGQYFEDCKNDIVALLNEQSHLVKSNLQIASNQCNKAYIDVAIPQLNSNPFIFVAYTHGIENGLRCDGVSFVSADNCCHFTNSLFYSTACLIGKKLAPELINNGCSVFVGYKDESEVIFEKDAYRPVFIECDNFALKMFLTKPNVTIGQSFEAMKNYYTNKIDFFMEMGEDILFISSLVANREALVCLGNKDLKKEDLFLSE